MLKTAGKIALVVIIAAAIWAFVFGGATDAHAAGVNAGHNLSTAVRAVGSFLSGLFGAVKPTK